MSERYTAGLSRFMERASRKAGLSFHALEWGEAVEHGAVAADGQQGTTSPCAGLPSGGMDEEAGTRAAQLELTL